jgi:hypothetical protein
MKNNLLLIFSFTAFSTITTFAQDFVPDSRLSPTSGVFINHRPETPAESRSQNPSVQAVMLDSSNLPIVYISTHWQFIADEPKITCDMGIIDHGYNQINHVTDAPNSFYGKIGIEKRGSISQLWPQKSYSIETRDTAGNALDVPLLGMPSDNDWVLYGPYDDETLMRNVMSYELGREMGYWTPRTKYVEVVINTFGWPEYQGVYVLMEKIKRDHNRVDIAKLDSTENSGDDLTGGYIWAIDRNIWAGDSGFVSSNPQNLFFAYKYPSSDKITQPQMDYLKAYTDSFENALAAPNFADPINGFRKFSYDHTFMDFFYFQEMSKNIDAYKRSAYLYKDKYSKGGKISAGPLWDFNSAWYNIHYCGFDQVPGWAYQMTCWVSSAPVPFWWDRMLQDTIFSRDLKCRWITWRSTVLDTGNIFHIIDSIANYIRPATVRQFANYNLSGTFQGQVDTLKGWVYYRLNWMDANMPGNCWNLGVHETVSENQFSVFPNPVSDEVNISFMLSVNEKIRIEVFDAMGRKVQSLDEKNYSAGNNLIRMNLTDQPEGVYFLNIISENGIVGKKILKMN